MKITESNIYFDLVEEIYKLEEQIEQLSIDIVNFVYFNLLFNPKFLNNDDVSERLDVLVDINNCVINTLETINCLAEKAYHDKDSTTLEKSYKEVLQIYHFFEDYNNYFKLLIDYKLCMDDHNTVTFKFNSICNSYDDYIKVIMQHYDLVLEEKTNRSIAKVEEMKLQRKTRQLVKLNGKYLKKLENSV